MKIAELNKIIQKYQVLAPVKLYEYNGFYYVFYCQGGRFSIPTLCNNLFGHYPHKKDWTKIGLQLEALLNNKGMLFIYEKYSLNYP